MTSTSAPASSKLPAELFKQATPIDDLLTLPPGEELLVSTVRSEILQSLRRMTSFDRGIASSGQQDRRAEDI